MQRCKLTVSSKLHYQNRNGSGSTIIPPHRRWHHDTTSASQRDNNEKIQWQDAIQRRARSRGIDDEAFSDEPTAECTAFSDERAATRHQRSGIQRRDISGEVSATTKHIHYEFGDEASATIEASATRHSAAWHQRVSVEIKDEANQLDVTKGGLWIVVCMCTCMAVVSMLESGVLQTSSASTITRGGAPGRLHPWLVTEPCSRRSSQIVTTSCHRPWLA